MGTTADSTINIRAPKSARALIDKAASMLGRNRSEFMLEAAQDRARQVLLDRTHFELDASRHRRFVKMLDEPLPADSAAAVKRLLERKSPWRG